MRPGSNQRDFWLVGFALSASDRSRTQQMARPGDKKLLCETVRKQLFGLSLYIIVTKTVYTDPGISHPIMPMAYMEP